MSEMGNKETDGKLRWDLLPYRAIEEVVKVYTYGCIKYAKMNVEELRKQCPAITRIDQYTPKKCVVHVTKKTLGYVTQNIENDKIEIGETGTLVIQPELKRMNDADAYVAKSLVRINTTTCFKSCDPSESLTKNTVTCMQEGVQYAVPPGTYTLITTIRQGDSEVSYVAVATTDWDSWMTISPALNEHSITSNVLEACKIEGDWNWHKGIPYTKLFGAMMRHLMKYWVYREDIDEENQCHHLASVVFYCLAFMTFDFQGRNTGLLDDRKENAYDKF